jgi:hypothetical protein
LFKLFFFLTSSSDEVNAATMRKLIAQPDGLTPQVLSEIDEDKLDQMLFSVGFHKKKVKEGSGKGRSWAGSRKEGGSKLGQTLFKRGGPSWERGSGRTKDGKGGAKGRAKGKDRGWQRGGQRGE